MDENKQLYTIILRHDTSTQWAVNNPILTLGEYAVEDDTHRVKRGDGETEWNDLPYEEFGLVYLVTYKNLSGEVSDNPQLQKALDEKMSIAVYEDVMYEAVSSINIEAEGGAIGKITKITKNINTATTNSNMLLIKSSDNSIQGYWSIDDKGVRILNLIAESSITDYEIGHMYYQDQLCYYKNILYRAIEDFESEVDFNPIHWVKLASLNSEDIKFNNLKSGLEADNVKDALDELQMLDSEKLKKTKYENKVYGTDENGAQKLYNKDDLRTVDSVNGKKATDQELKNIQIDSDEINYDDDNPDEGTVKTKLDSKVDKVFAGEGVKIVRDVQFNYNTETGHIELIEDKVSPEDSSSETEVVEIDVVSEKELADNVATINQRIDDEHTHFENKIAEEHTHFENKIADEHEHFENKIADEHTHFETRINEVDSRINTRIDGEVSTLNSRITNEVATLNSRIDGEVRDLNSRIDDEVDTLNDRIDTEVETLNTKIDDETARLDGRIDDLTQTVADNKTDIETKLSDAKTELDNKIDQSVETLNNTINTKEQEIYTKIQVEHDEINLRVDNEVRTLNEYIDAQDDLKIDKDIADNIVASIEVATHDRQPTIKFTSKNTHSKQEIYDYVHFTTAGDIITRMEDADHLVIDSTEIDTNIQENVAHLRVVDGRLDAIDIDIASLKEHDVTHDREIATNSAQIAGHETRILSLEERADGFDTSIADLDAKIENETTNRKVADAKLETDISRNALNIENNAKAIRDNADNIIELNNLLQENVTNLTQKKADKTFASETANKVVGDIIYTANGPELLDIENQKVSPVDGTLSSSKFKIFSTDNTVVAQPVVDEEGVLTGIDIATNLDTDVNYFVTTQILNTEIPSENVVDMSTLTATDKAVVEVQDIITDPEGTWSRVKSIDTEANTCVTITFKKHAQAVWGTVKGNIADQQDLQAQFTALDTKLQTNIDNEKAERITAVSDEATARETADNELGNRITAVNNAKLDKTVEINKVYGTDEIGNQKLYDANSFGKVDTVNGIEIDENKNVTIDAKNIDGGFKKGDLVDCDVNSILDYLDQTVKDLQMQLNLQILDYNGTINDITPVTKFITYTRDDGVMLMAMNTWDSLWSFSTTEPTVYENFIKDVENGYMRLIGIPEQSGEDPVEKEAEESFDILNEVDGVADTYEGIGGTAEEVEVILDDILN